MKPDQLQQMLRATLEDRKLSRSEKQALDQIFEHLDPRSQTLSLCRNLAFDLAREELNRKYSTDVVDWLEDINRLIQTLGQSTETRQIASEACFSPGDDCPGRIVRLLNQSTTSVDICVFTVTDDRISDAIGDAQQREVNIRLITDDDKSADMGSDIGRLKRQGVNVRTDRTPYHMHHKFAIFDGGKLLTGSYNWTRGAANNNEENFIITGDPGLVHTFARTFEQMWNRYE